MRYSFILTTLVLYVAVASFAASQIPVARVARALPPSAAEAHARAERHNAALRGLFTAVGVPSDSSPESVAARSAAVEAVVCAITNRAEVAGSGIRADEVAAAVSSLVSISTNATPKGVTP